MSLLTVTGLTHGFGDRAIFNNVSFQLNRLDKIGLVGANGEGKSTFMNIITGKLMPDEGKVEWAKNVRAGYLDQHAVLEEGMAYKPISLPPEDSQFLETKQFSVTEICRIFRVPPHLVADLSRATFSNIEYQSLNFVMHSLTPWLVRIEQGIIKDLLLEEEQDTYFPKFNVDGLLRGDYQSRMNGYAVGRQNGWFSANDIREMENMNPIPDEEGGNLYLINGAMTKLADAGAFAKTDTGQQNAPAQENSGKRGKR